MAKPAALPEWDTTQVNATVPDATHKAQGWLAPGGIPEKPPFQTFNYWMNETYRWLNYFDEADLLHFYPDYTATDQGITGSNNTLKYYIDTISSDNATIVSKHNSGGSTTTYTLTTSEVIPSNIYFKPEPGVVYDGAGTLTFDNPGQIIAGDWNWVGTITIAFAKAGVIKADWFGRDAAAVQASIDAAIEGSTIKLSGGAWAFGSSVVTSATAGSYKIEGVGSSDGSTEGTYITTSNAAGAFLLSGYQRISDMVVVASGAYGITLGNSGGSPVSWNGVMSRMTITGATTAGVRCDGIQLGALYDNWILGNQVGIIVTTASVNTGCLFENNKIRNNTAEGVLYTTGTNTQFTWTKNYIENNGTSGIKSTIALTNTAIKDNWFEVNGDAGAGPYYDLELTASSNIISVNDNRFNTIDTPATNKAVLLNGRVTMQGNTYVGHIAPYVTVDSGGTLIGGDASVHAGTTNLSLTDTTCSFYDLLNRNKAKAYTSNTNLERYYAGSLNATNLGASGTVILTLPAASDVYEVSFTVLAAHTLQINPGTGVSILPLTSSAGDDIMNTGARLGDTITLRAINSTTWEVVSSQGNWFSVGTRVDYGSTTIDLGSIAVGAMQAFDITVPDAALGDFVLVSSDTDVLDLTLSGQVTSTNTVTVVAANNTAGAVDLASAAYFARVIPRR